MKLAVLALALCGLVVLVAADCDVSMNVWIGDDGHRRHRNRLSLPDGSTLGDGLGRASAGGNPFFHFRSSPRGKRHSGSSEANDVPIINSMCGFDADLLHKWYIYEVPTKPDPCNPPQEVHRCRTAFDRLPLRAGYHYVFWYRLRF